MASVFIPYRGDIVSARLNFKKEKKKVSRKFKRKILEYWSDLNRIPLWSNGSYTNDKLRKLLGIDKDFLKGQDTAELAQFGVELQPTADINKVLTLDDNSKDYLINKAVAIFTKYGFKIKTAYADPTSYDYRVFKDDIETLTFDEADKTLAFMLYEKMVMYMVNNDSSDTIDEWQSINPLEVDFWNGNIQSSLQYYTYTLTVSDIEKMIRDRLFKKRNYRILGKNDDTRYKASTIDLKLFNELLDENLDTVIENPTLWSFSSGSYTLNIEAVKQLDEQEFLLFIQTHLNTYYTQVEHKKKWYQKGIFGVIVVVVVVVIAVMTQQYWLIEFGASLGTVLMVAGFILSIGGALIGNKVMMIGGSIVSLAGGYFKVIEAIATEQLAIESAKATLQAQGLTGTAITQAMNEISDNLLLKTCLMEGGKFTLNVYSTMSSLLPEEIFTDATSSSLTPAEKINEIYVADDTSWDFVNQFMPEYQIESMLKIM